MRARQILILAALVAVAGLASCKEEGDLFVVAADTAAPETVAIPPGGSYNSVQMIMLLANEPATIYYTTDGSDPTVASTVYTGLIPVMENTTLKYFARDTAGNTEAVNSDYYQIFQWTYPKNITNLANDSREAAIAIDSSDVVYLAYNEYNTGNSANDVCYRTSANWSLDTNVSNTTVNSSQPDAVFGPLGNLHMTWTEGTDIFYANQANWSLRSNVSNSGNTSIDSSIVITSAGAVHVAWAEHTGTHWEVFYANSTDMFAAKVNVSNTPSWDSQAPEAAIDSNGIVHLVWRERDSGTTYETFYANSTNWSTHTNISNASGTSSNPEITVDQNDVVHVVWQQTVGVGHEIFYANSTDWVGTQQQATDEFNIVKYNPSLTVDSSGTIHVVWDQGSPAQIYYANSYNWTITLTDLSATSDSSAGAVVGIDSGNIIHVAWQEDYNSMQWDIFYTKSGN